VDTTDWLKAKLFMQEQVMTGDIYNRSEDRLLDLLNGGRKIGIESQGGFIILKEVIIQYPDGKEERLPVVYAVFQANEARGLGGQDGYKPYPFIEKSPKPVKLQMPGYVVTGYMHRTQYETARDVLDEDRVFLPLTNTEIICLADGSRSEVPFVAVNKAQIMSLQEKEIPPQFITPLPESGE
jgi:hypothetical protein